MEYPKPRCPQCSTPLPLRTITIKAVLCWNCEETINVAAGYKDHLPMPQASFTRAERDFAHRHGVVLDRRYSHTAMTRYLANVCPRCDHMQGDWFIYFDPNRDVLSIERARRETHGPCDKCSTRSCPKHGAYIDYDDTGRCPHCLRDTETVACSVRTDLLASTPAIAWKGAATSAPGREEPDYSKRCCPEHTTSPVPRAGTELDASAGPRSDGNRHEDDGAGSRGSRGTCVRVRNAY